MSDSEELVSERHGAVLSVRLNRPEKRNALSWAMLTGINSAIADAAADPEIRAVVLTGTGDRAFCAGMDLQAFAADDGTGGLRREEGSAGYMALLEGGAGIPLVGAINASALAGGLELMLACDVVVTSSEAKFGLPEVKRGLFAGSGVLELAKRIPLGVALELALTGDAIDAERAYELGLVNQVVAPDEVFAAALAVAERIAANGPIAVAATRELVRMVGAGAPNASERRYELLPVVFESDDAREGARAFVEKRAPQWKGH